jgi:hypothetical protein
MDRVVGWDRKTLDELITDVSAGRNGVYANQIKLEAQFDLIYLFASLRKYGT